MGCNLAIAGVTGAVGQEFLKILAERDFPFDSLKMLASSRSAGKKIEFKGKEYIVEKLSVNSFERVDIALFSAGRVVRNSGRQRLRRERWWSIIRRLFGWSRKCRWLSLKSMRKR